MSFQERFRRLGRKRHHEAVVGLRQVHREVVRLALHATDDHQRFAEVGLRRLPADASAARTSPAGAASRPARSPSRSCSRPCNACSARSRSKIRFAVCRCFLGFVLSSSRMASITPTQAPAWAASPALSAGSPAEPNTAASSAPSREPVRTPALPPAHFCPRRKPLAAHAHRAPLCTPLRCSTIAAVGSTEPNQFRYPRSRPSPVKQESGGLLLLRRITPLARRNAVYFRSGAYNT